VDSNDRERGTDPEKPCPSDAEALDQIRERLTEDLRARRRRQRRVTVPDMPLALKRFGFR